MKRREFVAGLGAMAMPLAAARAQESGRIYRIGFLAPVSRRAPAIIAFLDELRLRGFAEGQNLTILPGGFEVRNESVAELVSDMVKAAPDVIISGGDLVTDALHKATRTIPIMVMTEDLVAGGFAASMARPGRNMSGISLMSHDLDGKRQEILIEAVPGARRIAALADSNVASLKHLQVMAETARARGRELLIVRAARTEDVAAALDDAKAKGAAAVNVLSSPLWFRTRRAIIDHIVGLRLPAIYQWPEMAEEGGLIAYGPSFVQIFRQRARMTARILNGANPAELPVEQPTIFELAINLKVAKAIGHDIPANLVLRADKVIE
jgi:putative ABC transport system substrate-binding protein